MTSSVVPRKKHPQQVQIPFWEQELRKAKNDGKQVRFQLAIETFFADEDCTVFGYIVKAEKNAVKIKNQDGEFWINCDFVVGTEISDA